MDRDLTRWAVVAASITAGSLSTCAAGLALAPATSAAALLGDLLHVSTSAVARQLTPSLFIVGSIALTAMAALLTAGIGWVCTRYPAHRPAHR